MKCSLTCPSFQACKKMEKQTAATSGETAMTAKVSAATSKITKKTHTHTAQNNTAHEYTTSTVNY